jgi:hypothetical protein
MTRNEYFAALDAYEKRFGFLPAEVPLDLGHVSMTREEEVKHIEKAIKAGKPIDWYQVFPPMPDGALS